MLGKESYSEIDQEAIDNIHGESLESEAVSDQIPMITSKITLLYLSLVNQWHLKAGCPVIG